MTEMIFSVGSFLLSAWNTVWPIAVAILLFAFDKVWFAVFALMIGFFCSFCKRIIEKSERK